MPLELLKETSTTYPPETAAMTPKTIAALARLFCRSSLSLVIVALTASACLSEPEVYCETFDYGEGPVLLAVRSDYYALPRTDRDGIALRFRYRDFAALKSWYEEFDWDEMTDANWTLDRSNYPALLQIDRIELRWNTQIEDFKAGAASLREIPSDWEGWTKLEICPHTCNEHFYLSDKWRAAGVSNVGCFEADWREPKYMSCAARDHIHGLQVTYFFPVTKKAHFEEFRARVTEFIDEMAENASSACQGRQ